MAQVARDLDIHENVLRKWVQEVNGDPQHAFPGNGQMRPVQLEINRDRTYGALASDAARQLPLNLLGRER